MNGFIESYAKLQIQTLRGGIEAIQSIYKEKFNIDLTEFNGWYNMIELTYRRNLFIHNKGVINHDYLKAFNHAKNNSQIELNALRKSDHEFESIFGKDKFEIGEVISSNEQYIIDGIQTLYNFNIFFKNQILGKFYNKI